MVNNLPLKPDNEIIAMLCKERVKHLESAEACSILIASLSWVDTTPMFNRRLGEVVTAFGGKSVLYQPRRE